jgi:glycosyltransferase involved in cell wall biosynthesis
MINVSVIIPNYNHASVLTERIESVLAQTYPHFEIIILDDCSTDNSKEIIEKYRSHHKISHIVYAQQNSSSPFRQWQKGIELAAYEWIWIAESDDFNSPFFLATGARLLEENPLAGLFYCDAIINDGTNAPPKTFAVEKNAYFKKTKWSSGYFSDGIAELQECLAIRCTINNASSTIMRTDLLKTIIAEAAGFQFHGDWYCYIAIAGKAAIIYDAAPLNTYRVNSSGVKSRLPDDGKHKVECFRILSYLCHQLHLDKNPGLIKKFTLLNLNVGLFSGQKEWRAYFGIDKKLARKVFFILLLNRFSFSKKSSA